MKHIFQKLKNNKGFTLSETLVAVVILVMISAAALPAALNAYRNAVDAANAQALLSITVDALRGELSTAWDVKVIDDDITYQSADTGNQSRIYIKEKIIYRQEYNDFTDKWFDNGASNTQKPPEYPLVSNALTKETRDPNNNMIVTFDLDNSSVEGGCVKIAGLAVSRGDNVIAEMPGDGLMIRFIGGDDHEEQQENRWLHTGRNVDRCGDHHDFDGSQLCCCPESSALHDTVGI